VSSDQTIRRIAVARRACALLAAAMVASAAVGCGGSGGDSTTTTAPPPPKPKALSEAQAALVVAKTPKDKVIELLKSEPVLTQGPIKNFPQGCIYYPIEKQPLSNVWQFCFNNQGVNLVLTQYSNNQPAPPKDASPQRTVLLARADSICQSQYGYLSSITEDSSSALKEYSDHPTPANLKAAGNQLQGFIDNLKDTEKLLAAFDAPDDQLDVWNSYLDSLNSQIDVLTRARTAFLKGDTQTYKELGKQFTEIGTTAKQQAKDYGLTYCSASSFG
jgi:predicted component of type VI protein secretion system